MFYIKDKNSFRVLHNIHNKLIYSAELGLKTNRDRLDSRLPCSLSLWLVFSPSSALICASIRQVLHLVWCINARVSKEVNALLLNKSRVSKCIFQES